MTITPTLWRGLSQVNTTDGGKNQFNPQITPLQNGGYVVVWVDANRPDNPTGQLVMGQAYDFLGNKVGGEVKLSVPTGLQNAPSVTTLTNGNIAVAFQDDTNDNIHVRVFSPALNLVRTDNIDVDASAASSPTITALSAGSYAVIYRDSGSTDVHAIHYRIVSATGVVSPPQEVFPAPLHSLIPSPDEVEVATLSNGNMVVVAEALDSGQSDLQRDIEFVILSSTGGIIKQRTEVVGANTPDPDPIAPNIGIDETKPDVAALTGGGFVVVWTRSDDTPGAAVTPGIGATIYNSTGTGIVKANIQVNASVAGAQHDASVTALKDGGFVVVWADDALHQTRGQRFNATGTKIGIEFVLNTSATLNGAPFEPTSVTLLSDGRIAFAVENTALGEVDVLTSIWDPRISPIMGTNASENLTSRQNGASVFGLGGNDNIVGFSGTDTLDGGTGNDILSGGTGNDTFVIDSTADVLQDSSGIDLVRSTVSKTLALGFEHLTLLGTLGLTGTGNASANAIIGNTGSNILNGLAGNDVINGGTGADRMNGGANDDTYTVDNAGDVVTEAVNQGIDTIRSTVTRILPVNVENLLLLGAVAINGTGNTLNNAITGNAANNVLSGSSGNDVMNGGTGNDVLIGGGNKDTMTGGAGLDDFDFNVVAETGKTAVTRDVITDFAVGDDMDLSTIDANVAAAGNNAFSFLAASGAIFTGLAGQLRWQKSASLTLVEGDINGDRVADFQIQLTGSKNLIAADFIL